MKRRDVIKNLSILPAAGVIMGSTIPFESVVASAPVSEAPAAAKPDLFKELGVRTFINARGTITALSGCIMQDCVMDAINGTSKKFCMIEELQDKVGAKIAEMVHSEAAMVTAGCWSALVLGTAGAITGMDQKKVQQLPNTEGLKNEILVQKTHNNGYVHALKNTGAKIVEVETAEDVAKAINEKTAMMWFLSYAGPSGKITDKEWVALGKKYNVPTMIDMAADVPPVSNLWKYNDMGFDMVCISGGKGLRGPQSAGILMGKKDLVAAARLSAPPKGGNIGRGMKVNKEEILGMYAALKHYLSYDHEKEWKMWEDRIAVINNAVKNIKGITTEESVPEIANHTPNLTIKWDPAKIKLTGSDMVKALYNGNPAIEANGGENSMSVAPWMMLPGEEKIVAARIKEELLKASV
ncbi:MAG TPA: PLP-dependent transferase [Bacteroidales bacterium]|nr:PLP-dependent transferase [Bacteroidales bacterium]HPT22370.1 PLP-dependent transferase [Bacteroidales bacterium]